MPSRFIPPVHGGDLTAIARRYGCDVAGLIDFSANINPAGPPPAVLRAVADAANDPDRLARYPDPNATPLRVALAARLAVDPASIVVSNGAAAAIDAAVRAVGPSRCLVPVPAFSEYRRALRASGGQFVAHELAADWELDADALLEHAQRARAEMLVLTNPHNPSGHLTPRAEIAPIIERCEPLGIVVLVDEAFIDYAPRESILPHSIEFQNSVVIRSMTKFYGMAGLRAGYAVAAPALARKIIGMLPSWPIGTIEMTAALAALGSPKYEQTTLRHNAARREALTDALRALAIGVFPSSANFLLLELSIPPSEMDDLIAELVIAHGIVVRDCRPYETLNNRSLVRVAVRSPDENSKLTQALSSVLGKQQHSTEKGGHLGDTGKNDR